MNLETLGEYIKEVQQEKNVTTMQEIHEQVKQRLQESDLKCNTRVDLKRIEQILEVGDLILAHLRKEIFPKGEYNKLKLKKNGPCNIFRKFLANDYEIEFPLGIRIFPILNVVDIYKYQPRE